MLDRLVNDKPKAKQKTFSHYLIKIARLGGYLARASDPPPGNTIMWRGLSRLTDIALGVRVGEFVGIESYAGCLRTIDSNRTACEHWQARAVGRAGSVSGDRRLAAAPTDQ
ncbi:hypothetical protein M2427_005887 [Bradyrhizobium sp. BR13661]|nr:hypothetical protein [Bradyrhizobium sp. BR13661]